MFYKNRFYKNRFYKSKLSDNKKVFIKMLHAQLNRVLVLVVSVALGACSAMTRERPVPNDPAFAPVVPSYVQSGEMVTGAIYQPARNFSIYGDRVALNVGDILTVVLEENTQSSKTAETTYEKDDELSINEATILGNTIRGKGLSLLTNPSMQRSFDGSASSGQRNSLRGNISVTVAEVLPNGVLRIQGEKWLKLNQGDEYIRLTGLVRPQDIGTNNTILSSKVADARIAYGGTGEFDDVNRQGWLTRFFNSDWWFM